MGRREITGVDWGRRSSNLGVGVACLSRNVGAIAPQLHAPHLVRRSPAARGRSSSMPPPPSMPGSPFDHHDSTPLLANQPPSCNETNPTCNIHLCQSPTPTNPARHTGASEHQPSRPPRAAERLPTCVAASLSKSQSGPKGEPHQHPHPPVPGIPSPWRPTTIHRAAPSRLARPRRPSPPARRRRRRRPACTGPS